METHARPEKRAQGMPQAAITHLLQQWSHGDRQAAEQVFPLVYGELRRLAAKELRRERGGHTLQATAIVHEAYLRLREQTGLQWCNRRQFFAFAAHLIRRILVDYARHQNRRKRGGQAEKVTLTEAMTLVEAPRADLVAVDETLVKLEEMDPRKAMIVELRFFAGFTLEETAAQLGISPETVGREWRRAKAWLYSELVPAEAGR